MTTVLRFLSGLALLIFGRQIYWLFVGAVGFLIGLDLATRLLRGQPELILIIIGLAAGIVGALLAIVFQRVMVGIAGFAAGGLIMTNILEELGMRPGLALYILVLIGAIAAALLVIFLFDWALIVISSIAGAAILVRLGHFGQPLTSLVFLVLVAVGIAIQAVWYQRQQPTV